MQHSHAHHVEGTREQLTSQSYVSRQDIRQLHALEAYAHSQHPRPSHHLYIVCRSNKSSLLHKLAILLRVIRINLVLMRPLNLRITTRQKSSNCRKCPSRLKPDGFLEMISTILPHGHTQMRLQTRIIQRETLICDPTHNQTKQPPAVLTTRQTRLEKC